MTSIVLKSPAKINLCLNVLSKRSDGYHNIQTIFEKINLFDTISITSTKDNGVKVTCDHPDVPQDRKNLAYKSAALLKRKFNIKEGLNIKIKKRIPVAAGLGGGSSNAACVLEGMNRLFRLRLNKKDLMRHAAKIGSDVPFFLSGERFAWATGRGTKITPLNVRNRFWHVLVAPKINVSTREIYQDLSKVWNSLTRKRIFAKIIISGLRKKDILSIDKSCFNLLEEVALRRFKQIYKLKNQLKRMGLKVVLMSGSGPSVFGIVSTRKEAMRLSSRLQKHRCYQAFAVRTW